MPALFRKRPRTRGPKKLYLKYSWQAVIRSYLPSVWKNYFETVRPLHDVGTIFQKTNVHWWHFPEMLMQNVHYCVWSYLWNWNWNGWAMQQLPASPLTKRTQFECQHQRKRTPTLTWSSSNLGSFWVAKSRNWRLEHSISNAWHIPLWMLVEFIVCTVIGYNLYKNTACVVHISASVYLMT